jgi:thiopeptide-type bacteriocin biosynthesis protein
VLGADVVEEIARGVELAHRLGRPNAPDPELERFRERFNERYGWSEVPLLEALDPEIGIGFGAGPERRAPLVEDVFVPAATRETAWGAREDWLLARLWELQRRNVDELLLSAHDIEELAGTATVRRPLPDELSCIAALAAGSPGDLRSGRFRVLIKEYGGPGRVGTLGRFCLADPGLREAVRSHLRAEEALDEEAIFAEIVHLPSEPHADLLARPPLREYEIDCLGPSGAPPVRQIPLSDLRLSVGREGHLVLRSERLDHRVVPRLTAAHNFEAFGAKPYRFLCKLQFQGTATGADFWGPLAAMQHLPRVRSGRIVLERARWRLTEADVPAIQRWRAAAGAPRFVGLSEQDMELPVDLDNVLSVESLAQAVRSNGEALLVEWFPQPGELCVHGPEGGFVHELLVPFVRARPVPRPRRTHRPPREAEEPRRPFAPGSEWLYARWFVNASAIDRVLLDVVGALVRRLREAGAIDRWFFMRSDDPVFHLRLRLHTVDTHGHAEAREALRAAAEPLLGLGVVAHVELATYLRETGRYGGPEAFALAEEMFHADSDAVLELLPLIRGDPSGEARWRLALQGMHALLVDLALDLDARLDLARDVRAALVREEAISADDAKRIGQRFRRERGDLAQLLMEPPGSEPVFAILEARSERVRPLGDRLREVERNGLLTRPLREVAASIAHMHLNRVVQARHREHELVIYDFLTRLYEAASHRKEE